MQGAQLAEFGSALKVAQQESLEARTSAAELEIKLVATNDKFVD
jgi:hypothetical protein